MGAARKLYGPDGALWAPEVRIYTPGVVPRRIRKPPPLRIWEYPRCAIAHVHTDTSLDISGSSTTMTPAKPTGVLTTEVMVAVTITQDTTTSPKQWTGSSGWTEGLISGSTGGFVENDGFNSVRAQCHWALGNVASMAFTSSGGGGIFNSGIVVACFSGVDNTTAFDVVGTGAGSTDSLNVTAGGVTTVTDQCWLCIVWGDINNLLPTATGFTRSDNAAINCVTALLYNTTPKGIGGTGTTAISATGNNVGEVMATLTFALRPASSGDTLMGQACL